MAALRPALFLDRDGVINEDRHYLYKIEDFRFVEGIFDLCQYAKAAGMALVVVTNQSGIGRGYYTEEQFQMLTGWMCREFADRGVSLDAVYHCPYHPGKGIGKYLADSPDRKPNPGMLLKARQELGLDLGNSWLVGDSPSDIEAAQRAGVGRAVLLTPENGGQGAVHPDFIVKSLAEVIPLLRDGHAGGRT